MGAPARRTTQSATPAGAVGCLYAAGAGVLIPAMLLMWADGNGAGALILLVLLAASSIALGRRRARQAAELRHVRMLQSTEVARYHAMNPREFEHAVAFLCERDGCQGAQVVGGAGDLGADVVATAPDGRRLVIQCKRYGPTTKVGSPDLQRFGGTCYSVHGAQVAVVVTTSVFTKPAAQYAVNSGIRLFDEAALAAWATRTGPAPWLL
ncbi:restriction endonuclease [Streptomyces fulvoviolaceus]|uniref:restriction endonuclease n=1 Tax=Streptomyces fulvoviolaceus TaxID=285535 RepID=UPI0009989304|nr:restriction endonuclease [Streptomyces fulvoviolaceus]MCT9084117.1 restriction endonuclease [Streptomyces fulvoviolaceus]